MTIRPAAWKGLVSRVATANPLAKRARAVAQRPPGFRGFLPRYYGYYGRHAREARDARHQVDFLHLRLPLR